MWLVRLIYTHRGFLRTCALDRQSRVLYPRGKVQAWGSSTCCADRQKSTRNERTNIPRGCRSSIYSEQRWPRGVLVCRHAAFSAAGACARRHYASQQENGETAYDLGELLVAGCDSAGS
jgi:hypothetical protein